jgi:hypothetical protein
MSGLGQTAKNSLRAYVFRFAPELGHCSTQSALRICANRGSRGSYSITSSVRPLRARFDVPAAHPLGFAPQDVPRLRRHHLEKRT